MVDLHVRVGSKRPTRRKRGERVKSQPCSLSIDQRASNRAAATASSSIIHDIGQLEGTDIISCQRYSHAGACRRTYLKATRESVSTLLHCTCVCLGFHPHFLSLWAQRDVCSGGAGMLYILRCRRLSMPMSRRRYLADDIGRSSTTTTYL